MTFGAQIAMDGNNSLKRADEFVRHGTKSIDKRKPRTDYWQTPEQVDVFKDEVKPRVKAKVCFSFCPSALYRTDGLYAQGKSKQAEDPYAAENDYESIIEESPDAPVAICIERWRNASPEERKTMWGIFDETGLFVAVCRHGFIVTICDMIKSGEL